MKPSQKPSTSQNSHGAPNSGPTAAQAFGTRRADRGARQQQSRDYDAKYRPDEAGYRKYSVPPRDRDSSDYYGEPSSPRGAAPRRSRSTGAPKKTGFMPSDPDGDEPPATNTSAYFTRRYNSTATAKNNGAMPDDFSSSRSSRASTPMADPLKQFREQQGEGPFEPRISTPYATHGGEKTNPFDAPNLSRSKSTRDSPSPFRTTKQSPSDDMPRTSSDPNLTSKNRNGTTRRSPAAKQQKQRPRQGVAVDIDSSDSDYTPSTKSGYKSRTSDEDFKKNIFAQAANAAAAAATSKSDQTMPSKPSSETPSK